MYYLYYDDVYYSNFFCREILCNSIKRNWARKTGKHTRVLIAQSEVPISDFGINAIINEIDPLYKFDREVYIRSTTGTPCITIPNTDKFSKAKLSLFLFAATRYITRKSTDLDSFITILKDFLDVDSDHYSEYIWIMFGAYLLRNKIWDGIATRGNGIATCTALETMKNPELREMFFNFVKENDYHPSRILTGMTWYRWLVDSSYYQKFIKSKKGVEVW